MGRTHIFFFCVLLGLAINFPLLSLAAELPDRAADIPLPLTHSVPDPVRLDDFAVADFRTRGFNASRDANRVLLDQYWGPFSTYFKGLSKKVPINKLMEMQAKLRAEADKGSADRLGLFDVSDGCFYRNGMGSQIMEEDLKKMGLTMDEVGATILMKYMPNDEPLNDAEREAFDNWKRSTDKVRQQVASEQQADAAQRMKDDREAREDAQLDAELRVKKLQF